MTFIADNFSISSGGVSRLASVNILEKPSRALKYVFKPISSVEETSKFSKNE